MNPIKKLLFYSLVFIFTNCLLTTTITAQSSGDPQKKEQNKQRMEQRMAAYNAMLDSLHLTEQQRDDVNFINSKYKAQLQQIRQNSDGDREAMRPKMKELRDSQNAELKEVLTEEQFAEYQKWQKENRGRRGKGGPPKD